MYNELSARKYELLHLREEAVREIKRLKYKGTPEYHLRIYSDKNQIYVRGSDYKEKYLPVKMHSKAKQIAAYDYLTRLIKIIDADLKPIEKLLKNHEHYSPESYYDSLSKGRQSLITPLIPTDAQFVENWLSQPYEPKGFDENDVSDFRTVKDERVRSKSEIIIANALERKQVPYKYECPIYFEELGVIHPDFTALNVKRRKILYWEHLGKMDDPLYARKNTFRINVYQKNGLYLGDNLIVTMETSTMPLDVRLLDKIIDRYLLQ